MERYLKDEPKLRSLQKLPPELDTAWDIFATPSVTMSSWKMNMGTLCLEDDSNERHLDTLSTSSASSGYSAMSWDSAVSCSVVVKKEPLDDDYDDVDLSCYAYDMELLRPPPKDVKRLKRGTGNDSNNNSYSCHNNVVTVKSEPRSSRLAARESSVTTNNGKNTKQHNQARNMSSSSHSDSSSSTNSSSNSSSSSSSSSRNHSSSYQKAKQSQLNSPSGEAAALVQPKTESTIELKLLARAQQSSGGGADSNDLLPILTPPSSPESIRNVGASEAELALLGHQGLIRVSTANGNIPRSAVLRLSSTTNSAVGSAKGSSTRTANGSRILHVSQGLPTSAVAQRNANMPTAQASTSKWSRLFGGWHVTEANLLCVFISLPSCHIQTSPKTTRPQSRLEAEDTQMPVPRLQEGLHKELPPEGAPKNAHG